MPTVIIDQAFEFDPAAPPPVGTFWSPIQAAFTDNNDDGLINRRGFDNVDGVDIRSSWRGDTITIDVPGVGLVTYEVITFYLANGDRVCTPIDGQVFQAGYFVSSNFVSTQGPVRLEELAPVCFMPGSLIDTPTGPRPIEALRPGDLVTTVDSGAQPIVYCHHRVMPAALLEANPRKGPVCLRAGSLGHGLPVRDLWVSPQHRVLLRSKIVDRMFGTTEILAPAAQLCEATGIGRGGHQGDVTYIHIALAQHHVIRAEGAEVETLFMGENLSAQFTREDLTELYAAFPQGAPRPILPARALAKGPKLKNLVKRHIKNNVPLCAALSQAGVAA